jgi:hypothetical protein
MSWYRAPLWDLQLTSCRDVAVRNLRSCFCGAPSLTRGRVCNLQCNHSMVEVEVTLRLTVSQSVCLGIEHPCGTCDQILLPVEMLLSEICGLVSVERPLWREGGSAVCSVITQWSESRRARNHTLLSYLRLPQPGGPGSRIYIPQEQGRSRSYFTTDGQSVSMSWYRAPLWGLRPDITSCRNVAVWNLRSCFCGALSLTRGRVCNLQWNHWMVRVAQNP